MSNKLVQLKDGDGNSILPRSGMLYRPSDSQVNAGLILPLPRIPYGLIDPTHTPSIYLKEMLKWICSKYPGYTYTMWIGVAYPSSAGPCYFNIYNTNEVDEDGYPRYASGHDFRVWV